MTDITDTPLTDPADLPAYIDGQGEYAATLLVEIARLSGCTLQEASEAILQQAIALVEGARPTGRLG